MARQRLFGDWIYKIFGPPTVQGAIQGWQPEARAQYKRRLEKRKQDARERRARWRSAGQA